MIKNYLKIAFRNVRRNKVFSAINIAGLAIGMAVFILMAEYVVSEWSSNRFLSKFDQLYRIGSTAKAGNSYYLQPGFAPAIKERFPSVEATVRVADGIGAGVISSNTQGKEPVSFREENIFYVEGNFLDVFDFPFLSGNKSLYAPRTAVISEKIARKVFGKTDAAGQTINISNQFGNTAYTVSGVVKDIPASSDIRAELFLSIHTLENAANRDGNDWADPNTTESGFTNVYTLLRKGTDVPALSQQVAAYIHSVNKTTNGSEYFFQPFRHLHLAPSFDYPYQTFGSLQLVTLLLGVALLILFIAWINYINLSTVQSLRRVKESGVRKVLGASRLQLALQFLSETLILTIISIVISILLVNIFQPVFNRFTGIELSLSVLNNGWIIAGGILLVVGGALLSGGYVAFVLSAFKPTSAFKSKPEKLNRGISLRKGLVVFQFSISIVFIIATIVLYNQLEYMKTQKLGISLDQLLVIKGPTVSNDGQADRNYAFKTELLRLPFVKKASASNNIPGIGYNFSTENITRQVPEAGDEKKSYKMFICDQNFFDTYSIGFSQGKTFTEEEANGGWNNSQKLILNEKAAEQL
ncbi:MAG: ABC transporter permease, partial [Gemmatimonadaceae bacterium]|nr:ABC transporter permease [Chitinophagaceae bacterium]